MESLKRLIAAFVLVMAGLLPRVSLAAVAVLLTAQFYSPAAIFIAME